MTLPYNIFLAGIELKPTASSPNGSALHGNIIGSPSVSSVLDVNISTSDFNELPTSDISDNVSDAEDQSLSIPATNIPK